MTYHQPTEALFVVGPLVLFPAAVALGLRWRSKRSAQRRWAWHDFFAAFALPNAGAALALSCYGVSQADLSIGGHGVIGNDLLFRENMWLSEWFFAAGATSYRISLALLFLASLPTRKIKVFTYASLVAAVVLLGFYAFALGGLCQPLDMYWRGVPSGRCYGIDAMQTLKAVFNFAVDLWVLGLSVLVTKRAVSGSLGKKIFGAMCALLVTVTLINAGRFAGLNYCFVRDEFLCEHIKANLSVVQVGLGILAACIPVTSLLHLQVKEITPIGNESRDLTETDQAPVYRYGSGNPYRHEDYDYSVSPIDDRSELLGDGVSVQELSGSEKKGNGIVVTAENPPPYKSVV